MAAKRKKKASTGEIVGIVVGAGAILTALYFWLRDSNVPVAGRTLKVDYKIQHKGAAGTFPIYAKLGDYQSIGNLWFDSVHKNESNSLVVGDDSDWKEYSGTINVVLKETDDTGIPMATLPHTFDVEVSVRDPDNKSSIFGPLLDQMGKTRLITESVVLQNKDYTIEVS